MARRLAESHLELGTKPPRGPPPLNLPPKAVPGAAVRRAVRSTPDPSAPTGPQVVEVGGWARPEATPARAGFSPDTGGHRPPDLRGLWVPYFLRCLLGRRFDGLFSQKKYSNSIATALEKNPLCLSLFFFTKKDFGIDGGIPDGRVSNPHAKFPLGYGRVRGFI